MKYTQCEVLDEKVLDIFREIEINPVAILPYTRTKQPLDTGKQLKDLESKAVRIQVKIDRLTDTLADADGSTAAKYIIAQICHAPESGSYENSRRTSG